MTSIQTKKRHPMDVLMLSLIYVCAALAVALLLGIAVFVTVKGLPNVNWSFLTSVTSVLKGTTGIAGNIVNTLYIIVLTMLIATPIGVGAAIYLNEYAKPGKFVNAIEFATETLSGIPSIIFGLFGLTFFGELMGLSYSILTNAGNHHRCDSCGWTNRRRVSRITVYGRKLQGTAEQPDGLYKEDHRAGRNTDDSALSECD